MYIDGVYKLNLNRFRELNSVDKNNI